MSLYERLSLFVTAALAVTALTLVIQYEMNRTADSTRHLDKAMGRSANAGYQMIRLVEAAT